MSAKDSANVTTGVVLSKARGKTFVERSVQRLGASPSVADDPDAFDLHYSHLLDLIDSLAKRLATAEQKLNNMQVDPGTKVVTYPDT